MDPTAKRPRRAAINVDAERHFSPDELKSRFAGILLMVGAVALFACLDTTAKYLGHHVPTLEVVWFRFSVHFVLSVFIFRIWSHRHLVATKRPVLQLVRALCLLGSTMFNFMALRYLQLAETMSIMFAGPLMVTALAGPLLGEWAGRRRWAAIVVGFCGVLVVTQPGVGGLNWAVGLSLMSMLCLALYSLLTRILTETDSVEGMLVISAAVAMLAMTPAAIDVWETPSGLGIWALLLLTGILGGTGHWLLIKAHALVPAPVLAPFFYSQLVWMIGLGFIVFGDLPGSSTIIGASIVIASGLYLLYRERKLNKRNPPIPDV